MSRKEGVWKGVFVTIKACETRAASTELDRVANAIFVMLDYKPGRNCPTPFVIATGTRLQINPRGEGLWGKGFQISPSHKSCQMAFGVLYIRRLTLYTSSR